MRAWLRKPDVYKRQVQSSLYLPEQGGRDRSAYFYDGAHEANHDVVIVGWDDSFPREAFSPQPEGDGAFLCANSWGEGFGEQGFFYRLYLWDSACFGFPGPGPRFLSGESGYKPLSLSLIHI